MPAGNNESLRKGLQAALSALPPEPVPAAPAPARKRGTTAKPPPVTELPSSGPTFSKLLLVFGVVLVVGVTVFTCAVVWKTENASPLEWLIGGAFGAFGVANGFYFWKAKAENKVKILIANGIKPSGDDLKE